MKRISLVEDDLSFISGSSFATKKQGYGLGTTRTCLEAEALWINGSYDLVTPDVPLPGSSGYDLCGRTRQAPIVPIMFLAMTDGEMDIIMGLDIGGDNYTAEPSELAVFLSRINALLRGNNHFNRPTTKLTSNGITVDRLKDEVYKNEQLLDLTASEYKLLYLFMEHPDTVPSPKQILGRLRGCNDNCIDNNILTAYIRRLRIRIEDYPDDLKRIVMVRRMGYRWDSMD